MFDFNPGMPHSYIANPPHNYGIIIANLFPALLSQSALDQHLAMITVTLGML